MEIVFSPAAIGAASADLTIGGESVELTGTSEVTCLTVSPKALEFGHVAVDDAGVIATSRPQAFQVSTQCPGQTLLESIVLQSGPGDSVAQFSVAGGLALPATIANGTSLTYQVYCEPTTLGTHTAQLLVSDGTVATLLPMTCTAP